MRELRMQRGMRQEDVAFQCGMSSAVLSRKENGKQPVNRTDITRLIKVLMLSADEAFELWCAAGMVALPLTDPSNGALHAAIERLGGMDVPALLLYRSGNLRAWNGCAEVIFRASQGQVRRTTLHIFDMLAAWEPFDSDPQMQHESVSTLLSLLAPVITSEHSPSALTVIMQRLPNTPIGYLIRECWPALVKRHVALHQPMRSVIRIPTPVGTIPFMVTYCSQEYGYHLVLMTLIPKCGDGVLSCDQLREQHQHIIQTVFVRE